MNYSSLKNAQTPNFTISLQWFYQMRIYLSPMKLSYNHLPKRKTNLKQSK